jgi:hypothetical protein
LTSALAKPTPPIRRIAVSSEMRVIDVMKVWVN